MDRTLLPSPKTMLVLFGCLGSFLWGKSQHASIVQTHRTSLSLTRYVNPLIGSAGHGHVFVGASTPFGAVQLGPTNLSTGWDWCSGYHYSDSTIVGFQHTHLSGTGIGDLGDLSFLPTTGPILVQKGNLKKPSEGYYSLFDHRQETVKPGFYKVKLKRYGIIAELTATERVGFHRYTFPKSSNAHILIDLEEGIGWDQPVETFLTQKDAHTMVGYRFSKGWAKNQRIYFAAVFSKPITQLSLYDSSQFLPKKSLLGRKVKGVISFNTRQGEQICIKVGISAVSVENALLNIQQEIPGFDFQKVVRQANAKWNAELQKIQIQTGSIDQKVIFYTALYHCLIAPSIYNDVNGDYRGANDQIYRKAPFTNMTTFSLWDTYRAVNPLFTLIEQKRTGDMVASMLAIFQQQGKLPVWHLMSNETNTMVGYSAVPVISNAILNGIRGFNEKEAFEACKKTAMRDDDGLSYVKERGYIPAGAMVSSVAMGLEYALDDACISKLAERMGAPRDAQYYNKRAHNYALYFDRKTKFMRGKMDDSTWRSPFDPFESRHTKDDYTEGNAWQYTWLVPQDVRGLIGLFEGEKRFGEKLDSLFWVKGDMGSEASKDISGLLGQYAHGNEPSHHIAYLYDFLGQPWKTADKVYQILKTFYSSKMDGLIGNEDVGQMSAWYILSSLGFYPVNPAGGQVAIGYPALKRADIRLASGKHFIIHVQSTGDKDRYIQQMKLNGVLVNQSFLDYSVILRGGTLTLVMGSTPSPVWGVKPEDRPKSALPSRVELGIGETH